MGLLSRIKTWISGETLTASDLNAEFDNILNNLDPDNIEDASANATAMQATADPYPGGSESLATNLRGELQRLRYVLKQVTGQSQWYIDPTVSIENLYDGYGDFKTITNANSPYTAALTDYHISCDTSSGAITVNLPVASNTGKIYVIKKSDSSANAVTIDADGTETIDGNVTYTLSNQYDFVVLQSSGTEWKIIAGFSHNPTLPGQPRISDFTNAQHDHSNAANGGSLVLPPHAFSVHRNGVNQTISSGAYTKVQFTTEEFDTSNEFDNATNYRFTPTVAGKFLLTAGAYLDTDANTNTPFKVIIYKNGSVYKEGYDYAIATTGRAGVTVSVVVDVSVGDYFEVYVRHDTGASEDIAGRSESTFFTGCLIR